MENVIQREHYDVVIVGAGVAGAIMAKELSQSGHTVLLIEAGRATSIRPEGYASYVETFHKALAKTPNSAWPQNPNAPQNSVLFQEAVKNGVPVTSGYHVYLGPLPFYSTYTKSLGGTTLHFLGTGIRMIPEDFELQSRYGKGVDWPFGHHHLTEYYEKAELEMGVSADVREQIREGADIPPDYQFPMQQIPPSYLDRWLKKNVDRAGVTFPMAGEERNVIVAGTPATRNGMPNPRYIDPRTLEAYRPIGAPYDSRLGQRCEGNTSCVPICPVMAKYNALRSLYTIRPEARENLEIVAQAVASKIELDENHRQVTGITCKLYENEDVPPPNPIPTFTAKGSVYVIAAHAIENAKLLLASCAANSSDQVGRHLMDHPYLLTWGRAPEGTRLGVHRGPQITSEIPMRHGKFRKEHAAFRADIRNGSWDFATGGPYSNVADLVGKGLIGRELRGRVNRDVQRQISFGFQIEQLPDPDNRVEIREEYKDPLGNHRPVISYDIDEYTRRGMKAAYDLSDHVFKSVGGKNFTQYHDGNGNSLTVGGKPFEIHGSGHIMGTHRMGTSETNSVVNVDQRTWDHHNLFLVGCGNMPTIGTSNPTLTIAALAYKAVAKIKEELA